MLSPAVATGEAATGPAVLTAAGYYGPSITIGQSACTELYAGAAPGYVGGYQINCRVGQDVQSGDQTLQVIFDQVHLIDYFINPSDVTQSNKVMVPVK
jgi:uncharacterized protein (TIGR03437 family)